MHHVDKRVLSQRYLAIHSVFFFGECLCKHYNVASHSVKVFLDEERTGDDSRKQTSLTISRFRSCFMMTLDFPAGQVRSLTSPSIPKHSVSFVLKKSKHNLQIAADGYTDKLYKPKLSFTRVQTSRLCNYSKRRTSLTLTRRKKEKNYINL